LALQQKVAAINYQHRRSAYSERSKKRLRLMAVIVVMLVIIALYQG
jgi:hypothetical protein